MQAPVPGISMVFQSFALMPWLTVLENVELGLEAQGILQAQRPNVPYMLLILLEWMDLRMLSANYPAACSSVLVCQSTGCGSDVLLMDEPFSALDVLTAKPCAEIY